MRVSRRRFDEVYDEVIANDSFFEGCEYYRNYKERYLNTLNHIECYLPEGGRLLDIGSGQFAVLCRSLYRVETDVADIDTRYTEVLDRFQIGFVPVNLATETLQTDRLYDVIVLAEVIEHVPTPPYLVFRNLAKALNAGGHLIITTPNLYRLRNAMRMLMGQRIFDLYRVPETDAPLGHFIEYAKDQIDWHVREAGLQVVHSKLEQLTWGGASRRARLGRIALAPLTIARPLWRDSMVVVGKKPKQAV